MTMNRSLKRITQTLEQLEKPAPAAKTAAQSAVPSAVPAAPPDAPKVAVSFDLPRRSNDTAARTTPKSLANLQMPLFSSPARAQAAALAEAGPMAGLATGLATEPATELAPSDRLGDPIGESPAPVAPFAVVQADETAALNLPKFKFPSFANHRNGANPDLAANLLQDMLASVSAWRAELGQAVRQIQDLYREGPIVDGWLECTTLAASSPAAMDRLLDADRLADDGEDHPEGAAAEADLAAPGLNQPSTYQLCGLNADGRSWSCPCPPEQVPSVSLAIVRHQRLRQLLSRKQDLEGRLGSLAESLVKLHSQL
jgi:hypothetical protein